MADESPDSPRAKHRWPPVPPTIQCAERAATTSGASPPPATTRRDAASRQAATARPKFLPAAADCARSLRSLHDDAGARCAAARPASLARDAASLVRQNPAVRAETAQYTTVPAAWTEDRRPASLVAQPARHHDRVRHWHRHQLHAAAG